MKGIGEASELRYIEVYRDFNFLLKMKTQLRFAGFYEKVDII